MFVQFRLGFRQRRLDSEQPRNHPFGVGVHRRLALVIGDGGNGAGRIGANTGQLTQAFRGIGKYAAQPMGHHFRGGVQIAGAGVIAKSRPGSEDIIFLGPRQRLHIRPAFQKLAVVGCHRLHRSLLQHDFAEPDAIWIGNFSFWRPPGQHAPVDVIPGQQFGGNLALFCGTR